MNLDDYVPNVARKIIAYGPPKVGKTVLVGKLAEILHLHWFDGEDGVKSLMNPAMLDPKYRKNITLYRLPDTQSNPVMAETLLKVLKGGEVKICNAHGMVNCAKCARDPAAADAHNIINVDKFGPTDALVIDSVSQLAMSVMHRVISPQLAKNETYKSDWDDYRSQGFLLDRIFSILQAAPYNVICISHEQLVEMEDGRKKLVPIGGTKNFSKDFAKFFDDVVYCDKVNNKHAAFSSSTHSNSIITGSRTGKEIEKDPSRGLKQLFD